MVESAPMACFETYKNMTENILSGMDGKETLLPTLDPCPGIIKTKIFIVFTSWEHYHLYSQPRKV